MAETKLDNRYVELLNRFNTLVKAYGIDPLDVYAYVHFDKKAKPSAGQQNSFDNDCLDFRIDPSSRWNSLDKGRDGEQSVRSKFDRMIKTLGLQPDTETWRSPHISESVYRLGPGLRSIGDFLTQAIDKAPSRRIG